MTAPDKNRAENSAARKDREHSKIRLNMSLVVNCSRVSGKHQELNPALTPSLNFTTERFGSAA